MTTFIETLAERLLTAASYAKDDQVGPAAILWPDEERQWAPLIPRLRALLPVFTLGTYDPASGTGPSYWLRCIVDRTMPDEQAQRAPLDAMPVLYLPGVSKQELRAVEDAPALLQPLAELQYRGIVFNQKNGKDWTLPAFLQTTEGGLGIPTGSDNGTRAAILGARHKLADIPLAELQQEARLRGSLRAAYFNDKVKPDIARSLLEWLSDPAAYQQTASPEEWEAFRAQCRDTFALDPSVDGEITMARELGLGQTDPWEQVWTRYTEAPDRYLGVAERLRQARPKTRKPSAPSLFDKRGRWPQENDEAEKELRAALNALAESHASEARTALETLEQLHGERRSWVWAALGDAPLAASLLHLAALARHTAQPMTGATVLMLAAQYASEGWRADDAVMRAMASVERQADIAAVRTAIRAAYRPWLEHAANGFQAGAGGADFAGSYPSQPLPEWEPGTCMIFCDGLRLDLAHRLATQLEKSSLVGTVDTRLTALPSITTTAKPAVSPIAPLLGGSSTLDPSVKAGGATVNIEVLRRLLTDTDWQFLRADETGDPAGRAWTEAENIDNIGHNETKKLPRAIDDVVRAVSDRVQALIEAGWGRVVVVTDHGWMYLPGDLPKAELPIHQAEQNMRKGRCARLKEGATTDLQTVPWHWDANVRIAIAPGICCFQQGKEYEHGGLSPQECVTPILTVTKSRAGTAEAVSLTIRWRGLRCDFVVLNAPEAATVDVRTKAGDETSSVLGQRRALNLDGTASAAVEDDWHEGEAAFAVLIGPGGSVLAQSNTTVGGE